MSRLRPLPALVLAAACAHATHVQQPARDDAAASGKAGAAAQPAESEGGAAAQAHLARRPEKQGRPPLAAAPGGLFAPGGIEKLQKALVDRGYLDAKDAASGRIDEATSAAVRKFQGDQGLARTGNPDHETVRKLGLDPDQLFRKSSAAKGN